MTSQRAAQEFDRVADGYDDDAHHALIAEHLVDGIGFAEREELAVDVACGTGVVAFAMLEREAFRTIVAVDVSPAMIGIARRKAEARDKDERISWHVRDATTLPVGSGGADAVVCASSLHFLGMDALTEWRRVLRPSGRIAFSLPERSSFAPSPAFAALLAPDLELPRDVADASAIAARAGFTDVTARLLRTTSGDRQRRTLLVWATAAS